MANEKGAWKKVVEEGREVDEKIERSEREK